MDAALTASRVLMGDSLGFHIIFVLFSLTLPILVVWFEFMGIRRKNADYIKTAKLWSKIAAILVVAGVISGTVVALQMSLVWPGILKFGGKVIGLPFMYETYAFIIEAVFLGLYLATWNSKRVSQWLHWWFGIGIVVGSTLSAFAITSINAWMNDPTGFTIVGGKLTNVDVVGAMFSRASLIEFIHSMPGYYLAASLAIAAIYGFKIIGTKLKNRANKSTVNDLMIIRKLMIFATVFMVVTVIAADITGKYLATHQPAKLAAIEAVPNTTSNAPFVFGGSLDVDGNMTGARIEVPGLLSWLAGGSTNYTVTGLNDVPTADRPPNWVHDLFTIKLSLVGVVVALMVAYFALLKWRPKWLVKNTWLAFLGFAGLLGLVIVELGWMITEIGRQPWAVTGYVTTTQAVIKSQDITNFGYIFPLAYVLLIIVTLLALRKVVRDNSRKERTA